MRLITRYLSHGAGKPCDPVRREAEKIAARINGRGRTPSESQKALFFEGGRWLLLGTNTKSYHYYMRHSWRRLAGVYQIGTPVEQIEADMIETAGWV